jgi:hypothetical protein
VLATALWAVVAATALSGPFSPRSELWVATGSQKIKSHLTLVRAAYPKLAARFAPELAAHSRAKIAADELPTPPRQPAAIAQRRRSRARGERLNITGGLRTSG